MGSEMCIRDRAETAPTFDTAIVTTLLSVCKSVMGLFTMYPLNILLAVSVACACFGLFGVAKRSV